MIIPSDIQIGMSDTTQTSEQAKDGEVVSLPQKRFFRQRAHVNPIADHDIKYPLSPDETDWSQFYEYDRNSKGIDYKIRCLDVGCGFGGLLISLAAEMPPGHLALGMEIRTKVSEYVQRRIVALRSQNPDPHFKKTKHKWRIINNALLAEYAYVCAIDAIVYIATDVKELFDWMVEHFTKHPLFEPLNESELEKDKMITLITTSTEESKKVARNDGEKFYAAFKRVKRKSEIVQQQ